MNFFHFIITIVLSFFVGSTQTVVFPVEVATGTPAVASQEAPPQTQTPTATLRVDVPNSTSTEASSTPVTPIIIYVQVPQPTQPVPAVTGITSSPSTSMVDTAPTGPAPQFATLPSFVKSADGSITTVSFGTDIPATAVFYLADQPTPGDDLDAYTPTNTWTDTFQGFAYDFGSYQRPVFYAVKITANGQDTIKKGQVLAKPAQQ